MRTLVLVPVLFLSTLLFHGQTLSPIPPEASHALAKLQKEPFRAHMAFLADDLLEGRGAGKRGHEIAARYLATQFEALGLRPAGDNGTYFQRVPLRQITVQPDQCAVVITKHSGVSELKWGQDFVMLGSADKPETSVEAPVEFVGYGVTTPDGRYDDYAGADVQGKIAAVLYGAPPALPSELRAHLSDWPEKLRAAQNHGAVGLIVLWTPEQEKLVPWPLVISMAGFPSMDWLDRNGNPNDTFPGVKGTAVLTAAASEELFKNAAKSWAAVLQDAKSSKPQSVALQVEMRLRQVSRHEAISSPNVIAVLPGSDPKLRDEYVVYSAHLDHLGIGQQVNGDDIYNGAIDNASGSAALLVMAAAFQSLPKAPARSILFMAVTAEEEGLLGSDYFAHFPTLPIPRLVADINIDEAGPPLFKLRDVVAYGAEDSSLGRTLQREAERLDLKVSPDPEPEQVLFIRSDQYSFVRQGVPSVFVVAGTEAADPKVNGKKITDDWVATRYHSPSDDMNQPMDLDAAVQFMQLNFLLGYDVAQEPQRPTWNPGDFFGETYGRSHAANP